MAVQEVEGALAVDGVRPVEELDLGSVAQAQLDVLPSGLGELVGHPLVGCHAVVMATFDHEGARDHEPAELGVVEGVAQVELGHVVLAAIQVAVGRPCRDVLPNPLVVVGRANAQAVAVDDLRDTHGRLAAVAQSIERHARGVHEVLRGQPIQDDLVLSVDERPEGELERLSLAQHLTEAVLADVAILGCEGHEPALGQSPRVGVVGPGVDARIGHVCRPALEPVLAHHDRTLLARLKPAGHDKDAVGHHVGMHVEHHLVGGDAIGLDELAGPWRGRQRGRRDGADDLLQQIVPISAGALGEGLGVFAVGLLPEFRAREFGLTHEPLGVFQDLRIGPQLARRVVGEGLESGDGGWIRRCFRKPQAVGERTHGLVIEQLVGLCLDQLPLIQPGHSFQPSTRFFEDLPGHLGIGTPQFTRCGAMV